MPSVYIISNAFATVFYFLFNQICLNYTPRSIEKKGYENPEKYAIL